MKDLTILICLSLLIASCTSGPAPLQENVEPTPPSLVLAYVACQDFIEEKLASSTSVEWPSISKLRISPPGKESGEHADDYRLEGFFEAQNSSGEMIRTSYTCYLNFSRNVQWEVTEVLFEDEIEF